MESKSILLLSRSKIDHMIIETADELTKNGFNVVLSAFFHKEMLNDKKYPYIELPLNFDNVENEPSDKEFEILLKKANEIEKELDLNAFEAHQNYLLYGKYVRRYGKEYNYVASKSYKNSIKHFVESYKIINSAIQKYKIKYVFTETIDWLETYILNAMAKKGKFKMFTFFWSPIGTEHRVRLSSTIDRLNPKLNVVYSNQKLISKKNILKAENIIYNERRDCKQEGYYSTIHKTSIFKKYTFFQLIKRLNKHNIKYLINRREGKKFFKKELPKEKFISYFMQHTPEASVVSAATLWNEQQNLLELLSVSAKAGYKIVVKEHPRTFGRRPWQFYKELSYFSNIHFIDLSYDAKEIINKSEAVLSLTSSIGFTALLLGKKVFTLVNPFISICKSVKKINIPSELWKELDTFDYDEEDTIKFVAASLESSYIFPKGQKHTIFPKNGGGKVICDMIIDNIYYIENKEK